LKQKEKKKLKNSKSSIWLAVTAIFIFAAVAWVAFRNPETPSQPSSVRSAAPAAAAKYATLSPDMFTGRVREAYQAARDVPEVLKQVQCYCGCNRTAGHQSNFDCFTDEHGFG
jgi:hypothetical protein